MRLELRGQTVSVFLGLGGVGSQGKNLEEEAFSVKTRTVLEKWEHMYHPQWRRLSTFPPCVSVTSSAKWEVQAQSACFSRCL